MSYYARAMDYVSGVVAGRIQAGRLVRLACQRHLDDLTRAEDPAWPYRFDEAKAERACKFIELLPHVVAEWARKDPKTRKAKRLIMEPWQLYKTCMIFGWVKKNDGMRRFFKASIYEPRKNGKSTWAVGVGFYMFAKDNEPGAEVYSGAASKEQAWKTFGPARMMCKAEPRIPDGLKIEVLADSLTRDDGSIWEPVIGKPGDGASPHLAIIDEFHQHVTSHLRDCMETGMGARKQPLSLIISTAGSDIKGPCREDWKTCEKVLERAPGFEDETHFCLVYTIDADDDPWSEAALIKANPNWGVTIEPEKMLAAQAAAKRNPRAQSVFKTKHLNIWTNAKNAFFDLELWRDCYIEGLTVDKCKGEAAVIGLDLAPIRDFSALVAAIPWEGKIAVFGKYYTTRAVADQPHNQHMRAWEDAGYLTVFDGNAQDLAQVAEDAVAFYREVNACELAYDSSHAHMLVSTLQLQGVFAVDAYAGSGAKIPEFVAEFDQAMKLGQVVHDGNPVLEWALSNCVSKPAKRGMVFLDKESPDKKIDPAIAAVMAYGRAKQRPSGYAGTGLG